MSVCPCCSGKLLRHIRRAGPYWFCQRCRQEMPVLNQTFPSTGKQQLWLYIPLK